MDNVKKILLITSASNFERQKIVVKSIHQKFQKMDGYALYVFTCYGLFINPTVYDNGEKSIYSLLDDVSFDGCILEGNIGHEEIMESFAEKLREKKITYVTLNFGIKNSPYLLLDSHDAGCQIMKHLIEDHHCTKINMVSTSNPDVLAIQSVEGYKDSLKKYGIPVEENRIVYPPVSIPNGRELYKIFEERGILDAEAVVCVHDVHSIGYCLELEERGFRVPEDVLICSLNRSANSMAFQPDISGADRMDSELAERACELLVDIMAGKEVPQENYHKGSIYFGQSCGCNHIRYEEDAKKFKEIVLAKVEAGNQISRMMQYNDSLEEVMSLEEMSQSVKNMLHGVNCSEFFFCLNPCAIEYITSDNEYQETEDGKYFDSTMVAVIGTTKRNGEIKDYTFPIERLVPMEVKAGDLLIFYPVHHKERVYGYLAFLNEYLPIEQYNYRICHESIGISMENLRRQMLLRKSIEELNKLHMQDALTGLYNRFAWNRFQQNYIEQNKYCVVMMDMDGLKKINDNFGHLAGNYALCITANVIKNSADEGDLVIRYGGDEFQILSFITDAQYWEKLHNAINCEIAVIVEQQKLPYQFGISLGFCICDEEHSVSFEECCEMADQAMYENKKARKAGRI